MASLSIVPVEFHGALLHAAVIDGAPHVSVRSICDALGLSFAGQRQRILRHAVLASAVCETHTVAADGKDRETLCLPLDKLNGWLFGVSAARVKPELRPRLVEYQRECFDALARHFGVVPTLAIDGQTAAPAPTTTAASAAARWLLVQAAGSQTPTVTPLPTEVQVGTWAQLAQRIEAGDAQGDDLLALALASTKALLIHTANARPDTWADDVARRIASGATSLAEVQTVAQAAATTLYARTATSARHSS